ncbi:MAG: hypothetical protein ACW99R_14180 [Candidatus Hodarchaeales archaeon]|jgi:hypothetical protein
MALYFKFPVFSIIDDGNNAIPKMAQCPNCGIIHKVYDICKSEIVTRKEESREIITVEDLVFMLPEDYVNILKNYNCSTPDYEHLHFILENKKWNDYIVLTYEKDDDNISGKLLKFTQEGRPRIEPYSHTNIVG